MISKEIILKNEEGLHARPATEISKIANQYNAKSVLNIMSAGIKNNTLIKIICDGEDEENALTQILETFKNNSLI